MALDLSNSYKLFEHIISQRASRMNSLVNYIFTVHCMFWCIMDFNRREI